MLGVGWTELVVVGAVALIAIGPKDMPRVMYSLGRLAGKARAFMADMHRMLEQVSAEAEIEETLKKQKKADEQPRHE